MYGSMTGPAAWMIADEWTWTHGWLLFAMWAVMMTGMMLPSAAPTILLYAAVSRRSVESNAVARAYAFVAGYLVVWIGFSAVAVAIQWAFSSALILTPMLELSSRRASSAVLALAGVYQLTPFKLSCLSACQSPAVFIARHWHNGAVGALRMGMSDGFYCLGCCWALMLLLFVGGVMHLPTIGLVTLLVLLEKLVPWGHRAQAFTVATGSLLLLVAAWML